MLIQITLLLRVSNGISDELISEGAIYFFNNIGIFSQNNDIKIQIVNCIGESLEF